MSKASAAIGIDLGGSSVKAVALSDQGEILDQANAPFNTEDHMDWARTIRGLIDKLSTSMTGTPPRLGISAPGLASTDGASIAYMPGRLKGLVGLNWREFLSASHPVPVMNDAHAALLGESWKGAAQGFDNVILLTLGTGVGGAAMVDGRLLRGHTGKAGHLGHVCLDMYGEPDICGIPGSIEDLIGNATIEQRSRGRFHTTHELIAAHRDGDEGATAIWLKSIRALACAIGSFTNVLDPETVIIGGGIARAGDALFQPLRAMVEEVEWKVCNHQVQILPAKLGELAGAYGAAKQALSS